MKISEFAKQLTVKKQVKKQPSKVVESFDITKTKPQITSNKKWGIDLDSPGYEEYLEENFPDHEKNTKNYWN